MPPETEVIKQQMNQTRAALTEKLETLEYQVIATVRDTTSAVRDTAQNVGATVRDTVHDVRATMRETMATVRDAVDITRQMKRHPWLMMGGAVFAGYLGGRLLESLERGRISSTGFHRNGLGEHLITEHPKSQGEGDGAPAPPSHSGSSFLKALSDTFAPELVKLKRLALGVTLGLLRDKIAESAPHQMRTDLSDMVDRFTLKLGGEPTARPDLSVAPESHERI